MKTRTTLAVCLVVASLHISAQEVEWIKGYGTGLSGFLLAPDGQGNAYGAGSLLGPIDLDGIQLSADYPNIVVAKWDSVGDVVWALEFGEDCTALGGDFDGVEELIYDPLTDGIFLTGSYTSTLIFGPDTLGGACQPPYPDTYMYLAHIDADGNALWGARATGSYVGANEVSIDPIGNIHLFGGAPYGAVFGGQPDIPVANGGFHASYNAQGDLLLVEQISTNTSPLGAALFQGTEVVLAGTFWNSGALLGQQVTVPPGLQHGYLTRVDLLGSVSWLFEFKSTQSAWMRDCVRVGPDRIVALGSFDTDLIFPFDTITGIPNVRTAFLVCLDTSGVFQWITVLNSDQQIGHAFDLHVDAQDHVYLTGGFSGELDIGGVVLDANTSVQGFIARFDTAGVCRSVWDFGKVVAGFGSVVPAADGVYVSCAYDSVLTFEEYVLSPGLSWNAMVAKLDSLGGFTGIQSFRGAENNTLHIYANPTNGLCTIDLPQSLRATDNMVLSVYDNTGQLVQRVPLEFTNTGLKLDVRAQAKGIYHVELGDGVQRYTGTIVFE